MYHLIAMVDHHPLRHLVVVEAEGLTRAEAQAQVGGDALRGSMRGLTSSDLCEQQGEHSFASLGSKAASQTACYHSLTRCM